MSQAVSILPLTDDERAGLLKYSKEEEIFLQDLFKHSTFLKLIARANLDKPTTAIGGSSDSADVRLGMITGWELYEKKLFACRKSLPEPQSHEDVPDDYTQSSEEDDAEKT